MRYMSMSILRAALGSRVYYFMKVRFAGRFAHPQTQG